MIIPILCNSIYIMGGGNKLKKIFLVIFIVFVIVLFGCSSGPPKQDSQNEMIAQIKRYYANLHHPINLQRSLMTLEFKQQGDETKLSTICSYLINQGYKVSQIEQPKYVSYENPYVIYETTIKIEYPPDFNKAYKARNYPKIITEKVWINEKTRKIYRISSDDPFLPVRTINYNI
ncbi:hypothetical protein JQN58_05245 [Aneurinibacillus sp. BA2021]|nr:hypothetical protein [Aneurinibacillus sp. BA2021]